MVPAETRCAPSMVRLCATNVHEASTATIHNTPGFPFRSLWIIERPRPSAYSKA
jgi:hypothetical protein